MIRYQPSDGSSAAPTCPPSLLEIDPVKILARAMIELDACGQPVDAEALIAKTLLTSEEIETHKVAARDLAHVMLRRAA